MRNDQTKEPRNGQRRVKVEVINQTKAKRKKENVDKNIYGVKISNEYKQRNVLKKNRKNLRTKTKEKVVNESNAICLATGVSLAKGPIGAILFMMEKIDDRFPDEWNGVGPIKYAKKNRNKAAKTKEKQNKSNAIRLATGDSLTKGPIGKSLFKMEKIDDRFPDE